MRDLDDSVFNLNAEGHFISASARAASTLEAIVSARQTIGWEANLGDEMTSAQRVF